MRTLVVGLASSTAGVAASCVGYSRNGTCYAPERNTGDADVCFDSHDYSSSGFPFSPAVANRKFDPTCGSNVTYTAPKPNCIVQHGGPGDLDGMLYAELGDLTSIAGCCVAWTKAIPLATWANAKSWSTVQCQHGACHTANTTNDITFNWYGIPTGLAGPSTPDFPQDKLGLFPTDAGVREAITTLTANNNACYDAGVVGLQANQARQSNYAAIAGQMAAWHTGLTKLPNGPLATRTPIRSGFNTPLPVSQADHPDMPGVKVLGLQANVSLVEGTITGPNCVYMPPYKTALSQFLIGMVHGKEATLLPGCCHGLHQIMYHTFGKEMGSWYTDAGQDYACTAADDDCLIEGSDVSRDDFFKKSTASDFGNLTVSAKHAGKVASLAKYTVSATDALKDGARCYESAKAHWATMTPGVDLLRPAVNTANEAMLGTGMAFVEAHLLNATKIPCDLSYVSASKGFNLGNQYSQCCKAAKNVIAGSNNTVTTPGVCAISECSGSLWASAKANTTAAHWTMMQALGANTASGAIEADACTTTTTPAPTTVAATTAAAAAGGSSTTTTAAAAAGGNSTAATTPVAGSSTTQSAGNATTQAAVTAAPAQQKVSGTYEAVESFPAEVTAAQLLASVAYKGAKQTGLAKALDVATSDVTITGFTVTVDASAATTAAPAATTAAPAAANTTAAPSNSSRRVRRLSSSVSATVETKYEIAVAAAAGQTAAQIATALVAKIESASTASAIQLQTNAAMTTADWSNESVITAAPSMTEAPTVGSATAVEVTVLSAGTFLATIYSDAACTTAQSDKQSLNMALGTCGADPNDATVFLQASTCTDRKATLLTGSSCDALSGDQLTSVLEECVSMGDGLYYKASCSSEPPATTSSATASFTAVTALVASLGFATLL